VKRKQENVVTAMLRAARRRATVRGLPFHLSRSDIVIPKYCPVLGIPLARSSGQRGPSDNSPTLDRLDNDRGYIPGNIVIMSYRANRAKSDLTSYDLFRVARWMRRHGF
jgi:hypothetical protein